MTGRGLGVLALVAGLLSGCTGQGCDELAALQDERADRRAAHQALLDGGTATDEQIGAADDALHAFERRVYDLEQSCARR